MTRIDPGGAGSLGGAASACRCGAPSGTRESPASVRDVCVRIGVGLLLSWERIAPVLGGQRG